MAATVTAGGVVGLMWVAAASAPAVATATAAATVADVDVSQDEGLLTTELLSSGRSRTLALAATVHEVLDAHCHGRAEYMWKIG